MNNIKFNAWDNDKKQMAKVKAIDWGGGDVIVTCHLEYKGGRVEKKYPCKDYGDDIEFLPYTGLKDVDGKEVYKDCILENRDGLKLCIKYCEEDARYQAHEVKYGKVMNVVWSINQQIIYAYRMKIIGTIHGNPECLE